MTWVEIVFKMSVLKGEGNDPRFSIFPKPIPIDLPAPSPTTCFHTPFATSVPSHSLLWKHNILVHASGPLLLLSLPQSESLPTVHLNTTLLPHFQTSCVRCSPMSLSPYYTWGQGPSLVVVMSTGLLEKVKRGTELVLKVLCRQIFITTNGRLPPLLVNIRPLGFLTLLYISQYFITHGR